MFQEDDSTPIHLAAANGSSELLKIMFEMQPGLTDSTLKMEDNSGMTPLHRAAMFERTECVKNLIENVSKEEKSIFQQ